MGSQLKMDEERERGNKLLYKGGLQWSRRHSMVNFLYVVTIIIGPMKIYKDDSSESMLRFTVSVAVGESFYEWVVVLALLRGRVRVKLNFWGIIDPDVDCFCSSPQVSLEFGTFLNVYRSDNKWIYCWLLLTIHPIIGSPPL